jgi:hypothetical protein
MKKKEGAKKKPNQQGGKNDTKGYPLYPKSEDIYSKSIEEKDMDPENLSKTKAPNENGKRGEQNEKNFLEDMSGSDLDVPGSEADDNYKNVGNEDEENNYYSLGGDDHNDLEEDKAGV